jgi:hypothetical protein
MDLSLSYKPESQEGSGIDTTVPIDGIRPFSLTWVLANDSFVIISSR